MDSRNEPMSLSEQVSFEQEWSPYMHETASAVTVSGAKWTFVTAFLAALIVISVAWLAVQTMPRAGTRGFETTQSDFLPYRLFRTLRDGSLFGSAAVKPTAGQISGNPQASRADEDDDGVETRTVTLDSGDTLSGALENAGVSANDANAAVAALNKVFNPRSLRAGQVFDLTMTAAGRTGDATDGEPAMQLTSLSFSPSIEHDVTVTRVADGSYVASDAVKQLTMRAHRVGTTIDSNPYTSAIQAGIPSDVVVEMIHMFSYKVDFQRDIHPGDSFEVLYDYYYTPKGQPARIGNVSFARMHIAGKDITMYRYQSDANSSADYFDAKGESAKGMLMKTPVDGARITSKFGMRFHPVLGYTRMHKGIDFGVPIGTPVMAAGSGVVKYAGWMSGYGNFIIVDHGNGYSTGYGHLSRIGVNRGMRVRQAQVIARSGMTGIATGPHLHYEIRQNNVQVNPLKVKVASGRKLGGADLRKFLAERSRIDAKMASAKLETKVAAISAEKPAAK